MDPVRFDALARVLSVPDSRRRVLGLLTAVPVVGGLLGLLTPEETAGKSRRKRRKTRNKRRSGDDKKNRTGKRKHKKKPRCTPDSVAQTCAGRCGSVTDNCKQAVDCGPCTCTPACGTCEQCRGTTCMTCEPCCDDVCCSQTGSICHATTGACCVPDSTAQTCDGQCGDVLNNCGVVVDCESCTCDPTCPACQTCNDDTGQCVADINQKGDACGDPGQVCQGDGACTCSTTSCPDCTTCKGDGQCAPCADCCDGSGVCQDGETAAACGSSAACEVCTGQEICQGQTCVCIPECTGKTCGPDGCNGSCGPCTAPQTCGGGGTAGVCGCTPTTCLAQGKTCGTISDGCGRDLSCGSCANSTPICTNNVCGACTSSSQCGSGERCCGGQCLAGVCCAPTDCAAQTCQTVSCTGHQCVYEQVANGTRCETGKECQDGQCVCAPDCTGKCDGAANGCGGTCTAPCGTGQYCQNQICQAYDVCASGCAHITVQSAINAATSGATIRIGPGAYADLLSIDITKSVTLIGAGSGAGGTVLDSGGGEIVVSVSNAVVELRDLQVTGGNRPTAGGGGIVNRSGATLSLTRVLVTGNTAFAAGGILNGGTLILNAGATVTANTATKIPGPTTPGAGGGIYNNVNATLILNAGSAVTANIANAQTLGGGIFNAGAITRDPASIVSGNTPDDCRNSNGTTC